MTTENKLLAHMLDASGDKQACESCVGTGLIGGTECAWCVQPAPVAGDEPEAWRIDLADAQWFTDDLDEACDDLTNHGAVAVPLYTAEQLQAARAAAMEESAKICDGLYPHSGYHPYLRQSAANCAVAIRAAKETS